MTSSQTQSPTHRPRANKETATDLIFNASLPTSILGASSRRRDSSESLSTLAYRQIREQIVRLKLPPASVIDESELSEEFEIGLTPIRQALRRLALENLVVILPRRGTLVADLNMSDLQKIFEMRIEMEALAARLAASRATPRQIQAMEKLLDPSVLTAEAAVNADQTRNELLIQVDRHAHLLLAEMARNEFLSETLDWLYVHVLRLWHVMLDRIDPLDDALEEHRQIAAAIREHDAARAAAIMRDHVASFQNQVLSNL